MRGGWGGGTPGGADYYSLPPRTSWGALHLHTGGLPNSPLPCGEPPDSQGPSGTRCRWEPRTDFAPTPSLSPRPRAAGPLRLLFKNEGVIPGPRDAPPGALRGAPCAALNAACSPHGTPEPAPPPRRSPAPLGAPLPAPQSPETQLPRWADPGFAARSPSHSGTVARAPRGAHGSGRRPRAGGAPRRRPRVPPPPRGLCCLPPEPSRTCAQTAGEPRQRWAGL